MTLSYNQLLMDKYSAFVNGFYPLPDATFSNYKMDILWDGKTVAGIEWIDMAGGDIFDNAARQDKVR
ncbi:MAG: hypothetical protein RBR71_11475 [Gudongella sp.]|nr:hypothetical protein [Gudongella sp.]